MKNPGTNPDTYKGDGPSSWEAMSMGEGRKHDGLASHQAEECPGTKSKSPDGRHHFTAVSCVQSVEHFVCDHCSEDWWD